MARNLDDLKPNLRNPRTITDKKLGMLVKALAKFGDLGGIVYNRTSGQLVGGHQRLRALPDGGTIRLVREHPRPTKNGTVAEGYLDVGEASYAYREVEWDEATEMAANLAANKGAGEFDFPAVQDFVDELQAFDFDLDLTMFDDEELAGLGTSDDGGSTGSDAQRQDERGDAVDGDVCVEVVAEVPNVLDDDGVEPPVEPITKFGDSIRLGRHMLHCADADGHVAFAERYDVVFTDPPYGVGYAHGRVDKNKRKDWGGIENDAIDEDALKKLVRNAIPSAPYVFVCCDWKAYPIFVAALGRPKAVCVWDKGYTSLGKGYRRQHEFVMFFGVLNRNDLSDVWAFKRATKYQHPTQKPVPLVAKALIDVTRPGARVFDPFGGSGSTLLAAEQVGMAATLVECAPKYCDVIVQRWETLTGLKAERLSRDTEGVGEASTNA